MQSTNPSRPRPRGSAYIKAVYIAFVLIASAVILGWFGIQDIFGDTSYGVRLRAAGMIAITAYLVISAGSIIAVLFQTLSPSRAKSITIVGGVVDAITGCLLLIYQFTTGDPTWWLLVWTAMAILGASVVWILARAGAKFPYPRRFGAAVTATTLLAVATFAYSSLYQPSALLTKFSLNVDLGDASVSSDGKHASIPITVSFINDGPVGLYTSSLPLIAS